MNKQEECAVFEIYPSLISANILNLEESIDLLDNHCDGYHLDVMDNHFVPNLTWGAQFINLIAQYTKKKPWVHLMIDNPENFLDRLFIPQNTLVTFHIETKSNITDLIAGINEKKWQPGIAINQKTAIDEVFPYLDQVHQVLLMSVNPGFSGQQLIPEVLKKVSPLKKELKKRDVRIPIAMDGGINRSNIVEIAQLGITQFGIATGIFSYPDPVDELRSLYELLKKVENE